jgi:hypothetical protein
MVFGGEFGRSVWKGEKMKKNILCLIILSLLCSCSKVNTSVRLRPDLTSDDNEIWEIYARGNGFTGYDEVEKAIRMKAAETSEYEGYDCFVLYTDSYKTEHSSYTTTTNKTMYGQGNSSYSTDYYNNRGYYGSSQGNVKTNYSYQVPVTETYDISKPTATWYVFSEEGKKCKSLKNTKWRKNVYYNASVLNGKQIDKQKEKEEAMKWQKSFGKKR